MQNFFLAVALALLTPVVAVATAPSKLRQECARLSQQFKNDLPSNLTTVSCIDAKKSEFGDIGPDVMHAVAVAAFYERRLDRRIAAMDLLENYECKGDVACKEFFDLLDWGIKSGHPGRYSKSLATRAEALRHRLAAKLQH